MSGTVECFIYKDNDSSKQKYDLSAAVIGTNVISGKNQPFMGIEITLSKYMFDSEEFWSMQNTTKPELVNNFTEIHITTFGGTYKTLCTQVLNPSDDTYVIQSYTPLYQLKNVSFQSLIGDVDWDGQKPTLNSGILNVNIGGITTSVYCHDFAPKYADELVRPNLKSITPSKIDGLLHSSIGTLKVLVPIYIDNTLPTDIIGSQYHPTGEAGYGNMEATLRANVVYASVIFQYTISSPLLLHPKTPVQNKVSGKLVSSLSTTADGILNCVGIEYICGYSQALFAFAVNKMGGFIGSDLKIGQGYTVLSTDAINEADNVFNINQLNTYKSAPEQWVAQDIICKITPDANVYDSLKALATATNRYIFFADKPYLTSFAPTISELNISYENEDSTSYYIPIDDGTTKVPFSLGSTIQYDNQGSTYLISSQTAVSKDNSVTVAVENSSIENEGTDIEVALATDATSKNVLSQVAFNSLLRNYAPADSLRFTVLENTIEDVQTTYVAYMRSIAGLPTADADTYGKYYLNTGADDVHLYLCVVSSGTYSWQTITPTKNQTCKVITPTKEVYFEFNGTNWDSIIPNVFVQRKETFPLDSCCEIFNDDRANKSLARVPLAYTILSWPSCTTQYLFGEPYFQDTEESISKLQSVASQAVTSTNISNTLNNSYTSISLGTLPEYSDEGLEGYTGVLLKKNDSEGVSSIDGYSGGKRQARFSSTGEISSGTVYYTKDSKEYEAGDSVVMDSDGFVTRSWHLYDPADEGYVYSDGFWRIETSIGTDGKITAGAGTVTLDSNGLTVDGDTSSIRIGDFKLNNTGLSFNDNPIIDTSTGQIVLEVDAAKVHGALTNASIGADKITAGELGADVIYAGDISANQITSGTIGADVIYSGTVSADNITSGTLSSDVIYSGTIGADKITAGELGANVVYTGDLTADQIKSGTIGADVIYGGTIDADKINAGTLASGVIYSGEINGSQIKAGTVSSTEISSDYVYAGDIDASQIVSGSINSDRITSSSIKSGIIDASKITSGTLGANVIYSGEVSADKITSGTLDADRIGAGTITSTMIASNTITASNIASNTITSSEIATGAITADELASNSVTSAKINAGAVDASKISAGAITSEKIDAGAITTEKLASGAITADIIGAGTLGADVIYSGTIDADKINSGTLSSGVVYAGDVSATQITSGTLDAERIGAQTITSDKIASNTITASNIASGTITATELASGSVTADKIGVNAVEAGKIKAGAVTADKLATNAVTADKIKAGAVTSAKIDAGAITTEKLASGAVTADIIGAGTLSAGVIYSGDVSAEQITSGVIDSDRITADSIASGVIDASKITTGTLGADVVYSGTVDADKVNAGTLNSGVIYSGDISATQITSGTINSGRITADSIASGVVSATKITGGTLDASKVTVTNINATNIKSGTLSADRIGAESITAGKLATDSVTSDKIKAGEVTAGKLSANAVSSSNISANAITTDKINAGAVTSAKINAGAVTADKINAGAITSEKIATGAITADMIGTGTISTATMTVADQGSIVVGDLANGRVGLTQNGLVAYSPKPTATSAGGNVTAVISKTGKVSLGGDGKQTISMESGAIKFYKAGATIADDGTVSGTQTAYIDDNGVHGLANGSVSSSTLSNNAVTTAKIADSAVTSAKISSLSADKITTGVLGVNQELKLEASSSRLLAGKVTSGTTTYYRVALDGDGLHTYNLINGAVTQVCNVDNTGMIQGIKITADKIISGTIDASKIAVTNINASNITSGVLNSVIYQNLDSSNNRRLYIDTDGNLTAGYSSIQYLDGTSLKSISVPHIKLNDDGLHILADSVSTNTKQYIAFEGYPYYGLTPYPLAKIGTTQSAVLHDGGQYAGQIKNLFTSLDISQQPQNIRDSLESLDSSIKISNESYVPSATNATNGRWEAGNISMVNRGRIGLYDTSNILSTNLLKYARTAQASLGVQIGNIQHNSGTQSKYASEVQATGLGMYFSPVESNGNGAILYTGAKSGSVFSNSGQNILLVAESPNSGISLITTDHLANGVKPEALDANSAYIKLKVGTPEVETYARGELTIKLPPSSNGILSYANKFTMIPNPSGEALSIFYKPNNSMSAGKNNKWAIKFDDSSYIGNVEYTGHSASASKAYLLVSSVSPNESISRGSVTQPAYFNNGVPEVCTYSLNKTVPSDAVFTDSKVLQEKKSDNYDRPLLMADRVKTDTTNNTSATRWASSIYANASTGILTATKFVGEVAWSNITGAPDIPSAVTETTVSGWGFTKNAGTVTQVKVGNTAYNPSSGVVSLPAYPSAVAVKGNAETSYRTGNVNLTAANIGAVASNTAITGATKCKITYDSKGLVTAGADLSASDIPNLNASKITAGTLPVGRGGTGQTDLANVSVGYATSAGNATTADLSKHTKGIIPIKGTGTVAGTWLATSDQITEYYDGLTIAYYINVAGAATTTLNINNLGAVTVRRDAGNLTTHLPVGTVVILTYSTMSGTAYWHWADYDANNNDFDRYFDRRNRPYAGVGGVYRYTLWMKGADGRAYNLSTGGGAGATKPVQTALLYPDQIWYYAANNDKAANAVLDENSYRSLLFNAGYAIRTFNATIPTYRDIYLCGTIDPTTGMFKLATTNANGGTSVVDYYMFATTNNATRTYSPALRPGYVYIYVGSSNATADQWQLSPDHPMFISDGVKLMPYNTVDVRRTATVGHSGSTLTNTWYKFASFSQPNANSDVHITFHVWSGYGDSSTKIGTLTAHHRTNSYGWENGQLYWENALSGINTSKFVMLHTAAGASGATKFPSVCELWAQCDVSWQEYHFEVISEGTRTTCVPVWTLYNNVTDAAVTNEVSTAYTSSLVKIDSAFSTIQNNTSGNAASATTATKLGTATVGGTTTPIYLNAGAPTALGYTIEKSVPSDAKFTDHEYTAGTGLSLTSGQFSVNSTAGTSTLAWNSEVTLGTVGGLAIKAKLPANPNTNTTYTFATGDNNGQIKVTPSSGNAQNVSVKGLGTAAYTNSDAYATSGHTHSAYVNQNAFSNVKVGSTTVAADTATDTLELVAGTNITLTPDATNDKITITASAPKGDTGPQGPQGNTGPQGPQGVKGDGIWYGTCSTSASITAKIVTCAGFTLTVGAMISVKFTSTNTVASPTMNVNNTGAKAIKMCGQNLYSGRMISSASPITFLYDGTYWQLVGGIDFMTLKYSASFEVTGNGSKDIPTAVQTLLNNQSTTGIEDLIAVFGVSDPSGIIQWYMSPLKWNEGVFFLATDMNRWNSNDIPYHFGFRINCDSGTKKLYVYSKHALQTSSGNTNWGNDGYVALKRLRIYSRMW